MGNNGVIGNSGVMGNNGGKGKWWNGEQEMAKMGNEEWGLGNGTNNKNKLLFRPLGLINIHA